MRTEGRPYDGTEIRIVGDDDQPLPAGQVGSVIVNGPSRFLGFLNNDDLTRESLTDWGGYRTGDLGMLDEDGHFIYVGRSKDIIRRGGVTVVPAEVEPVILRHPDVHEVAIVPLPDDRLGERACAAIIAEARPHRPHACRAAGVPRRRGRGQVHVAGVRRGVRGVPAHAVAEGRQARRRQADPRALADHRVSADATQARPACCGGCTRIIDGPDAASCVELLADDLRFSVVFSTGPGAAAGLRRRPAGVRRLPRAARDAGLDASRAGGVGAPRGRRDVELVLGETRQDGATVASFVAAVRLTPDGLIDRYIVGRSPAVLFGLG